MTFTVDIDAVVTPVLSYAMTHNTIAFVDGVVLTSRADHAGVEVRIAVRDCDGVISLPWHQLFDLRAGASTPVPDARPRLDAPPCRRWPSCDLRRSSSRWSPERTCSASGPSPWSCSPGSSSWRSRWCWRQSCTRRS